MNLLQRTCARVAAPDLDVRAEVQRQLDLKTKPRGSLGRLEELAATYCAIRRSPASAAPAKAIVVMAGDHGVAAEGVSAFPQEVTAQMVLNFVRGGAAINALARHAGARLVVVDMGVKEPFSHPEVRSARVGPGTRNFTRGPAMTSDEALRALEAGIGLGEELADAGVGVVGLGDMGIANTTAASAIAAACTGASAEEVTGRGTGIDEETRRRKVDVVRRALEVNRPDAEDGLDVLTKLGGFEIAGLAGVALGAASRRVAVVMDGFISSAAALLAARLAPAAAGSLIASHRSVEAGHRLVLRAIGARPLLDLDLRLGEGTGAALAMGLIDASLAVLREMATFESAGVSDSGA